MYQLTFGKCPRCGGDAVRVEGEWVHPVFMGADDPTIITTNPCPILGEGGHRPPIIPSTNIPPAFADESMCSN